MFKNKIVIIAMVLLVLGPAILLFGFATYGGSQSDPQSLAGSGGGSGPVGDLGGINSNTLPDPLKQVFIEAGQSTGVPPAFLAATSKIECGRAWNVPPDVLSNWINTNSDVDKRACNFDNGYRVWGPMQFLDTTWGYSKGTNPNNHPANKTNSIGDQSGRRTKHIPAVPINIRDAIFGTGIKHAGAKSSAEKRVGETGWTDAVIKEIARSYCNGGTNRDDKPVKACHVGDLGYGQGVLNEYTKLRSGFGG